MDADPAWAIARDAQGLNALILRSSRDCIVVLDLDGNNVFISPGGIEAMEIADANAVIGLSWLRVWQGADHAAAVAAVAEARAGGTGRFQGFCPTHQGTPKWWDVMVSPLPGPDGQPERLVSVGRDITEWKLAEQRLQRSDERLTLALGAASMVGIWDCDLKIGVVYGDANFARIYGVDADTAIRGVPRGSYLRIIHPDDRPAVQAELDRMLAGADAFLYEHRIVHPDGSVRWALVRGRLVRDADGTPARFPGASVDITDRKLAEARQAFLLGLADRLRAFADPRAIVQAAVEALGRHLGASRVGYGTVQPDDATIALDTFYADGVAPIVGSYPLDAFGAANMARQRQGQTVVRDDVATDPDSDPAMWAAIETRAFVSVPLVRDGRLRATLYVNRREPCAWAAEDVALLEDVAARIWDAAERARTEAALRASEAHLAGIFAQTSAGLAEMDLDGRFTAVNDRYCAIVGRGREDLLRLRKHEIVHPDDVGANAALFERLVARGEGFSIEKRHVRADGSAVWVTSSVSQIASPGGPPTILAVTLDITKRKRVEERLAASEARFRAAVDAVQGVLWTNDAAGKMVGEQPGWAALTGQTQAQYQGLGWAASVHPADAQPTIDAWHAAVQAIRPFVFEHRVRQRDGAYRIFSVRAIPTLRADDTIREWVGVHTDVTDQRAVEQRLREWNELLEERVEERTRERDRLWQDSEDLLVVADYDGQLLRVSPSWTTLLGHSEAALLARPYGDIVHPDDLRQVRQALLAMRATGQPAGYENRVLADDGGWRWVAWKLAPEPGGGRLSGVGRDITAAKAREAELAAAQDALRQSQKMEAVGQLTGGLAHDFNNLLTGIAGNLELLGTRVAQGRTADLDRYIIAAQGAARRAASLTHRLLAFSRRQTLEPKPTGVNRLVASMEDLVRRTVGPHVAVEVVAAGGLWTTLVDPNQLENALLNLCINARDAMPDGGRLTIETGNRWLDERAARQRDLAPGQYVALSVSDTGAGMTPDTAARAFDPFFTTKPLGEGTGLGLSMVYGFARQSGGQARIYSEIDQGTMVSLYLPRHAGEADEAAPAEIVAVPRAEQGNTVLIVDDEPTVRMLVCEVLAELGYAAIEAADGPAGLAVLRSDARVDLLVTDVGLPGGLNGRQVADAGRAVRPGLKVLFITGYAENAVISHGHLDRGMRVLTKPFALDALAARITGLIAGG